jgi:hypothetical protein
MHAGGAQWGIPDAQEYGSDLFFASSYRAKRTCASGLTDTSASGLARRSTFPLPMTAGHTSWLDRSSKGKRRRQGRAKQKSCPISHADRTGKAPVAGPRRSPRGRNPIRTAPPIRWFHIPGDQRPNQSLCLVLLIGNFTNSNRPAVTP